MENFTEYCKNYILDHIDDYVGDIVDTYDFGFDLTDGPNVDGSLTYSSKLAWDYLAEWRYEAAEYWEYEMMQFGTHSQNPFDNPEAYMVCMVIEGVRQIISRAFCDLELDEEVELTQEIVDAIKEFVEKVDDVVF